MRLWLLVLVFFPFSLAGQSFDCHKVIASYMAQNPSETIKDTSAFCDAAQWANSREKLGVLGNFWELRPCECFSYERLGVETIVVEDVIFNADSFDAACAGFTFVMEQRIKAELKDRADSVGQINESWFGIDDKFASVLNRHIQVYEAGADSAFLRITDDSLDYLEGMQFGIGGKENLVGITELKRGVKFKRKKSGPVLLYIDASNYRNSAFCSCHWGKAMVIPLRD